MAFQGTILKASAEHGLLFGYAIVCTQDGKPYVDLHDEHIPEASMMKAALGFMRGERRAKLQHAEGQNFDGRVVFAYPLTAELAKAHGITAQKTGLLVGLKPDNPETLLMAKAGMLTGFSIGGRYVKVRQAEMEVD